MLMTQLPHLYIVQHPQKGRSVHCAEDIPSGTDIELCSLIILSAKDTKVIHQTSLHDYYFDWESEHGASAIALGYGSLYNHSSTPNAVVESMPEDREIKIVALKDIPAGDEITINYQGGSKDETYQIWFDEY